MLRRTALCGCSMTQAAGHETDQYEHQCVCRVYNAVLNDKTGLLIYAMCDSGYKNDEFGTTD